MEVKSLCQMIPAAFAGISLPIAPINSSELFQAEGSCRMREIETSGISNRVLNEKHFQMKNYDGVAIPTDLEPDDVLALAILFEEAKQIYEKTGKFPIQMIIVGEGNAAIKKKRLEKLLQEYFDIPEGVYIRVVEGKSTKENQFTYDGEELFSKDELNIPFPQEDRTLDAAKEIEDWAKDLKNPFIIQLKPAQELLHILSEIAEKISLLFYGSFNLRKTADQETSLQELMDELSMKFERVGILEQYGVLGNKGKVCNEHEWSNKIQEIIEKSEGPFVSMFRELSAHWNAHIIHKMLIDCREGVKDSRFAQEFAELEANWDPHRFEAFYQNCLSQIQDKRILRKLSLIHGIASSGISFTVADILVAMACTGGVDLFQANPVKIHVDESQFLVPGLDPSSNVVYYGPADHSKVANWIEEFLMNLSQ